MKQQDLRSPTSKSGPAELRSGVSLTVEQRSDKSLRRPAARSACETDLAECATWISFWEQVVVDAHDPVALGRWWAEALGWVVVGDAADEFEIRPAPDRVPGLLYVPVPEEKAGKNRLHLDFRPVDQTAEVERLLSLGARRADVGQRDASWVVLADPEGNEFCILRGRVRPDS